MIGWDILNKDNSFSFFSNYFVRSALFVFPIVCPPFVSANLAPSIFFARPCPFFRRLWSCFPLRPPLLSPPLLHPQIFKLFPPCLPFSARAELLFSFSPPPALQSPLFSPASPALPASPASPASPVPPASPASPASPVPPASPASPASPVPPASPAPPAPPVPPAQPFPPPFPARPTPVSCHPLSAPFCPLFPFFRTASPPFPPPAGGGLRARLTIGNKFPAIAFLFC